MAILAIIIIISVWIFIFIVNQHQNLTLMLTAACNLKLLPLKFYFLPLRLKKTASQSWWFSSGKRNFPISVFPGQLSSEEWKIQQCFARRSRFFTFTIVVPLTSKDTVFFFDMSPTQYNVLPSLSIGLANPGSKRRYFKTKSDTFYNSV